MALAISTTATTEARDVTDRVAAAVPDTVAAGTCTVFVRHTTAGLIVNEAEPGLLEDLESAFETMVPEEGGYRHDRLDGNAAAHLRASLAGSSVTVPVSDGDLDLGTWQSIILLEFDGPRTRRLEVVVQGNEQG